MRPLTRAIRPLTHAHTYRRWAYLVIGGALLMPFAMAALVLATLITQRGPRTDEPTTAALILAPTLCLALITATALIPGVRNGQTHLARALLQGPLTHTPHTTTNRPTARATLWLCLHLLLGMVASLATMVALTEAALLAIAPLTPQPYAASQGPLTLMGHDTLTPAQRLAGPFLALLVVAALLYAIALLGHLLARTAPHLLGPTPTERLAAAHAHAHTLAERGRLARELHDTLGHALSVVTLQAATAARLLDTDPEFARQALTHIADQARTATADLDHALGILREDTPNDRTPPPDLTHLTHLAQATRHTGTDLTYHITGDTRHVPALLSRETYRISQEALTNALRHAPHQPLTLTLTVNPTDLTLHVTNPLPPHTRPRTRTGGGHGITGMQERAHLLGGTLTARPTPTHWTLTLHLTWKETR
ncbi:histidine kinase [Nocardiopsis sp. Huas11]|uniref:sensor histidine kinase n=1 Tax=Nocardiopsis sp. Huas11 TaxID=2183912 RepID=UPI000EAEFE56|nr:histidine kinase [Nocardiopsis sp. Huas11]RKS08873.1 histidine kinase [Nocardiopsis sp. Huas11]